MKTNLSLFLMFIFLTVFSSFATAPPALAQSANSPAIASVAGSTWAGTDSEGDYYEYYFLKDGVLHYKSPGGLYKNGTWKQEGNSIYMETNNKLSERQGAITGNRMQGDAWNTKGHRWTWQADKK